MGASGSNWSELAGRYNLLTPTTPINEADRIDSVTALTKARHAASETRLTMRIIMFVFPSDGIKAAMKLTSAFLVMLAQNPTARSHNPCSLPTIIAALRSNTLPLHPHTFPRPLTSFCASLYFSFYFL
jgi:hypothetical protein